MINLEDRSQVAVQGKRIIKITLISLIVLAVIGLVSYLIYNALIFRVIKSEPTDNALLSKDINQINIFFNRELDETPDSLKKKIITKPDIEYEKIEVLDKQIKLTVPQIKSFQDYSILLLGIKSKDGQVITQKKINFKTDNLPEVEGDESSFPMEFELPISNSRYKIDAVQIGESVTYQVTIYAILNRPSQAESYRQQLHEYSAEALEFLKAKGVDPNKYKIEFNPPNALTY